VSGLGPLGLDAELLLGVVGHGVHRPAAQRNHELAHQLSKRQELVDVQSRNRSPTHSQRCTAQIGCQHRLCDTVFRAHESMPLLSQLNGRFGLEEHQTLIADFGDRHAKLGTHLLGGYRQCPPELLESDAELGFRLEHFDRRKSALEPVPHG
jgi:hypothetical protein